MTIVAELPQLPDTWFTAERLVEWWGYVRWFLKFNMPIFLIGAAVFVAYGVSALIIEAVQLARGEEQPRRRSDDEDDIEDYL